MIALPFIYFTLLGIYLFFKNKRFGVDVAAVTLLIVISFCAIMIDVNELYGEYGINKMSYNLFTLVLFCFQWTVVIMPLHLFSTKKIVKPDPIKVKFLLLLCFFMIVSSFLIIMSSMEDIKDALIMDMADVRDQHYKDLDSGTSQGSYLMVLPQIMVSIPFPTLALMLLFYLCSFVKGNVLIKVGIFLASIVQAVLSIIMAGRAAMIYWVFDFFLLFCFSYPYLSRGIKRVVVTLSVVMGVLIGIVFSIITFSRFDNGDQKYDPMESLYGYAGQHVNNFSIMIMEGHNSPFTIDREFPFISKTFFHKIYDMNDHYNVISKHAKVVPNVFDTFGGEVYLDLGIIGYVMLMLLLVAFYYFLQQKWKELTLSRILIVGIYVCFFTHGLFAWPFIGHYATMAIMLIMFFVVFFAVRFKI